MLAGALVLGVVVAATVAGTAGPGPQVVEIVAGVPGEMEFTPKEVTVRAGRPVRLTVVNRGRMIHDLYIDRLRVHIPPRTGTPAEIAALVGRFSPRHVLAPGQRSTVTFTPRRGRFEFWCLVPGHKELGMRGVLIVR
jgi:uncharacterized cupredoxin-like copper-binding protein